jgi:hypothetical protein
MLMLPARPFVHHRNVHRLQQRHATHNNQHGHHVHRQSSQHFNPQRSLGRLEMKELRGRLVIQNANSNLSHNYGATNIVFDDTSPNNKVQLIAGLYVVVANCDAANVFVKVGWA